jgi:hypothetical protein
MAMSPLVLDNTGVNMTESVPWIQQLRGLQEREEVPIAVRDLSVRLTELLCTLQSVDKDLLQVAVEYEGSSHESTFSATLTTPSCRAPLLLIMEVQPKVTFGSVLIEAPYFRPLILSNDYEHLAAVCGAQGRRDTALLADDLLSCVADWVCGRIRVHVSSTRGIPYRWRVWWRGSLVCTTSYWWRRFRYVGSRTCYWVPPRELC